MALEVCDSIAVGNVIHGEHFISGLNLLAELSLKRHQNVTDAAVETVRLVRAQTNVRFRCRLYTPTGTRDDEVKSTPQWVR